MTIQSCLITIWRTDQGVGAYGIRPVVADVRFAATAVVTLKGFAATVGRMHCSPV